MIGIIFIAIIGAIFVSFLFSMSKDNYDLQDQSLSEKFTFIVEKINDAAFNGRGEVIILDRRSFNLYEDDQNQIINFHYSTGHLTIIWKYKYYQKEVVLERQFNDVRNLSLFEQQKIARAMINEMAIVVAKHKKDVLDGI